MIATLRYELGPADLEAFFAHHASHAPYIVARNRRMRWVWGTLLALLALVVFYQSPVGGLAYLALAAVYLLFYGRLHRWWFVRHNRRLNAGPDGPRLGATRLEFTGGHLLVEAPEVSSKLELSAIRRIDESDSHYFVYVGPIAALVIPKAGGEAGSFVQALRGAGAAA